MSSTYLYIIYRKQNSFFIIYGKEFFETVINSV